MPQLRMRRRMVLGGLIMAVIGGRKAAAASGTVVGKAETIRGNVRRRQGDAEERLAAGGAVLDRDYVKTSTNSFADLALSETRILLGPETELLIDSFIAGEGGTLELGLGRMVFDRPQGLPKVDVVVRTAFGMIGVRGTKFFCGPSRAAAFAVFVEHGAVSVEGGGVTRMLSAGQGVDIGRPGAAPSEPTNWGQARIREAYASVGPG
ncbi:iron dicitrate transport regulator FecR [Sinorhizobium glycinis]|uniref:Iron dicitrate transport regulator FecR n=1 Tax=Sinorhizobium glycinis TaxID=1472378 RepID=A0A178Y0W3_9HYPH|nr:FecR family protein [Sinorhizobium glycinis]OAP41200.1 iron dicitrate transport regulator FecR [Sinorhizobium glycinis]